MAWNVVDAEGPTPRYFPNGMAMELQMSDRSLSMARVVQSLTAGVLDRFVKGALAVAFAVDPDAMRWTIESDRAIEPFEIVTGFDGETDLELFLGLREKSVPVEWKPPDSLQRSSAPLPPIADAASRQWSVLIASCVRDPTLEDLGNHIERSLLEVLGMKSRIVVVSLYPKERQFGLWWDGQGGLNAIPRIRAISLGAFYRAHAAI